MATAATNGAHPVSAHHGQPKSPHGMARRTSTVPVAGAAVDWRRDYSRRLWLTDLLALGVTVFGTQIFWLGADTASVTLRGATHVSTVTYWELSVGLISVWMWALGLVDSRTHRIMGVGATEYVRIVKASVQLFGVIAILAFLLRVDVARGYLILGLPAGVGALVASRWLWRQWLNSQRLSGRLSARVILAGSPESVAKIASNLRRAPTAGYTVVGACVSTQRRDSHVGDTPILGGVDDILDAMNRSGADTLIVTSTGDLAPKQLKEISWNLEAGRQHLVLAPNLTGIAGRRIHARPVAGLPLMHVETPHLSQGQRFVKRSFDILVAAVLIVLLAPVFLAVSITVKLSSAGPLIFPHERIGRDGMPFRMYKFRSMRVGADAELESLLEQQGTRGTPLFKIKDDPRITHAGRVLRKYSLDELPQLFNVMNGSMSLVGPRPQVADEVALYSDAARRRLITRPGVSGLWQVSGRSELSWDEAVELDLFYVENWSLVHDLVILMRTIRAVATPRSTAI